MAQHPDEMARLVGLGLKIKAIADAHPEAHIPAGVDALGRAARRHRPDRPREGRRRAAAACWRTSSWRFAQDATVPLQQTFASYMQYKDSLTYNHNSTSGGLSQRAERRRVEPVVERHAAAARRPSTAPQPDVGDNQSALQRFMQLLHDANGLDVCTKQGAVAHVQFSLGVARHRRLRLPDQLAHGRRLRPSSARRPRRTRCPSAASCASRTWTRSSSTWCSAAPPSTSAIRA